MGKPQPSVSLSQSNEDWVQAQIDNGAYDSKSDVVNALIRSARETEYVRLRLIEAEESVERDGWVTQTAGEMLDEFKANARRNGKL